MVVKENNTVLKTNCNLSNLSNLSNLKSKSLKKMSNISFSFDAEARLISFHQNECDYDPDNADDVDVYIACVLSPPQGILVEGDAVDYGMRKVISYRGLPEFLAAFARLDPSEHCIDFFFAYACEKGNLPVAQYLRSIGANVNGDGDDIALSFALTTHMFERNDIKMQRHYTILRFLLSCEEFDITPEDGNGSPWMQILERGYPGDIVEGFLSKGADPKSYGDDYSTPLCLAIAYSDFQAVESLLRYGADPNVCGERGWSPLALAASDEDLEKVQLLLRYGANPKERDGQGKLPREYAKGNTAIISALDGWDVNMIATCLDARNVQP